MVPTPGATIYLTSQEAVFVIPAARKCTAIGKYDKFKPYGVEMLDSAPRKAAVVRMKLQGVNAKAKATGLDTLPGRANYFIGNDPKKWHTNIPIYERVRYQDVYPGIDLTYYGKIEDTSSTTSL